MKRDSAPDSREAGDVEAVLRKTTWERREEQWSHVPYNVELAYLENIKHGEVEEVKKLRTRMGSIFPVHRGHLSENPHRQAIYEFVACAALVTRFAIEGGLETETAYTLSDAWIKTADRTHNAEEVYGLYDGMILAFVKKVRQARERARPSHTWPITRCMEYIDSNLHYRITLADLGRAAGRNPAYLCVQFKAETGMSVTEYVNREKVDAAKLMLREAETPVSEIAASLGFCSQSYFSKVFRASTGETPRQYRLNHFRNRG